jgi:type III pantothenate kinase
MLLAIDVGNTQTVYALWDGHDWVAQWRRSTQVDETEDQLAAWLKSLFDLGGFPFRVSRVIVASVVPGVDLALELFCSKYLGVAPRFLRTGAEVDLPVDYDPPTAVGADRLANCLAALAQFKPPIIVVDFGTATTFDIVDRSGGYVGGALMTGVAVSSEALVGRAAKLPRVVLTAPATAIGKNTVHAMQSGIMLGYAGAVDALVRKIDSELGGGAAVVATGGLGGSFVGLAETIERYEPMLTLDGLVLASERMR